MKFQHMFYTTALSIAVAAGSSAAFAQTQDESLDPVDRHGGLEVEITETQQRGMETGTAEYQTDQYKTDKRADQHVGDMKHRDSDEAIDMNNNDVEVMRERMNDEVLPNNSNRAVPGAPHAGKNPNIDPVAGEHDFVE